MPRTPINFSKNINYKLVCKDVNIKELYVGSTTEFTKRKNKHKSDCNCLTSKNYNLYVYQFIRANGGWDNWTMVQIEEYPCKNSLEAKTQEQSWIEKLQANLNSFNSIQIQTKQDYNTEYYQENKEQILEQVKEYYEENKEKILNYNKKYSEQNKEKVKEYQQKYREQNRAKNIEYQKEYYKNVRKK